MPNMILCPTRGGKGSYPNQDRAIAIAKERNAEVLFLYITNVEFLGLTAAPILRHGQFNHVLAEVIEEFQVETVVLGSSAEGTGVVTAEYLQALMNEIGSKTGVEFIIIDQGEIVNTFKP